MTFPFLKGSLIPGLAFKETSASSHHHSSASAHGGTKFLSKGSVGSGAEGQSASGTLGGDDLSKVLKNKSMNCPYTTKTLESSQQKIDPQKRLRNLKKRLRGIEDLERQLASGEFTQPDKAQLEKIAKKDAVQKEIEDLEGLFSELGTSLVDICPSSAGRSFGEWLKK